MEKAAPGTLGAVRARSIAARRVPAAPEAERQTGGPGHDANHQPAELLEQLSATHVADILPTVGSVLVTVVLDTDHQLPPPHVKVGRPARHPRRRPGPASAAAAVRPGRAPAADRFPAATRLRDRRVPRPIPGGAAPGARVVCRNGQHVADLELGRSGEGIEPCDSGREGVTAARVKGCPRRRRHPPPLHHLHLVGVQEPPPGHYAARWPRVEVNQLHRDVSGNPLRAVHRRGGQPRYGAAAATTARRP